jgi:hypothetical protein
MVLMHDHLQLRDSVGISPTSLPRGTFDITASLRRHPKNLGAHPNVVSVNDSPKRSLGETISQLVVIAILIAILVVAIIFLRQFISSHNSEAPAWSSRSGQIVVAAAQPSVSNRSGVTTMIASTSPGNVGRRSFELVTTATQHDSSVGADSFVRSRS